MPEQPEETDNTYAKTEDVTSALTNLGYQKLTLIGSLPKSV